VRSLLIIPAWKPEDIFPPRVAKAAVLHWQPTGLLYVAGMLIKEGHHVEFIDGAFRTHEQITEHVRRMKPDFVGIYSNAALWNKAKRTAADIKLISKDIHIAVGVPLPIAWKNRCIEESPDIDSLCTGEGEYTVVEMTQRLTSGQSLEGVQGIIYRDSSGQIHTNPIRPVVEDLDSIPFPPRYLLGDLEKYRQVTSKDRFVNIIGSRGCTNRCLYCFQIDPRRYIRFRSAQNVVDEVEECVRVYKAEEIRYLDDNFTKDNERAFEICAELKRRKLDKVPWYVSSRVDCVTKDLLKAMKDAGCYFILFGAESGVQKDLKMIGKNITTEQIKQVVKDANDVGLKTYTPFIFGIPGQTFEDGLKTIDFAIKLNSFYVNFHTMAPFPGTRLYNHLDKFGTMVDGTDALTFEGAAFVPHTMTREEIHKLRATAFKKYYGRPSYMLKRMLSIRNWHEFRVLATGAKALLFLAFNENILKRKPDHVQATQPDMSAWKY